MTRGGFILGITLGVVLAASAVIGALLPNVYAMHIGIEGLCLMLGYAMGLQSGIDRGRRLQAEYDERMAWKESPAAARIRMRGITPPRTAPSSGGKR